MLVVTRALPDAEGKLKKARKKKEGTGYVRLLSRWRRRRKLGRKKTRVARGFLMNVEARSRNPDQTHGGGRERDGRLWTHW